MSLLVCILLALVLFGGSSIMGFCLCVMAKRADESMSDAGREDPNGTPEAGQPTTIRWRQGLP